MKGLSILGSYGLRRHQRAAGRGRLSRAASGSWASRRAATWNGWPSRWRATARGSSRWRRGRRSRRARAPRGPLGSAGRGSARRAWSRSRPTRTRASSWPRRWVRSGLVPTYRALEAGKDVALANKETLVMAGELMLARVARDGRAGSCPSTASTARSTSASTAAGPRRCAASSSPPRAARSATAPARPSPRSPGRRRSTIPPGAWGRKITIDSATLMNKGLEVIEARWLFGVPAEQIEVLIHPQSVIHSMVEFVDGTVLAQLGVTDMRLPIQYALSYPERWAAAIPGHGLRDGRCASTSTLPDHERFPCLRLAYRALEAGRHRARGPERRQRGGRGRLPRRPHPVHRHPRVDRARSRRPPAGRRVQRLEDVLEADGWARERSREALAPPRAARRGQRMAPSLSGRNHGFPDHARRLRRRPRHHHLRARVRALHHRQGLRHAGVHLLVRLRQAPLRLPVGRHRLPGLARSPWAAT